MKNVLLSALISSSLILHADGPAHAQTKPSAAPAKVRMTIDKKPLPAAGPRAMTIKIAGIGDKLGALPEQVSARLYEFNSTITFAQQTRRDMTKSGIDLDGFNYIGDGLAGYTRTAMRVDFGRVQKLVLWKPSLSGDAAQNFIEKVASDSQMKPLPIKGGFRFRIDHVNYYVRRVGSWTRNVPAKFRTDFSQVGSRTVETSPAKSFEEPAGIEIGIMDFDWLALNVTQDEAMLKVIQEGRLVKGMRAIEAYLSMRDYKLYRSKDSSGGETWTWTDRKVEQQSMDVFSGNFGEFTQTHYASTEKMQARVKIDKGVVVSIEDDEVLNTLPK